MIFRFFRRANDVSLVWPIFFLTIIGLALRLYGIDEKSLWLDEAYSVWFSSQSWAYLWNEVPYFETHPPFYYSLLKFWRILGDSETTLRLLSVLTNVLTIPFVALSAYLCGNSKDKKVAAILAATFFVLSYTQLQSSQDARPYALMSLAMSITLASTLAIVRYQCRASASIFMLIKHDRFLATAYMGIGTGMALLAWSHNYGPVIAIIFGLYLLIWWILNGAIWGIFRNLSLSALIASILYLPNVSILLMQMRKMENEGFWVAMPNLGDLADFFVYLPFGRIHHLLPVDPLISLVMFLSALVGLWVLLSRSQKPGSFSSDCCNFLQPAVPILLLVTIFAPAIVSFILSHISQPIFLSRTLQASQIPTLVALSFSSSAALAIGRKYFQLFASVVIVGIAFSSALSYAIGPFTRSGLDWRKMTKEIALTSEEARPTVVVLPNSVQLPFLYYSEILDIPLNILTIPGPYPAISQAYHYPAGGGGVPGITSDMIQKMSRQLHDEDTVWYVHRGQDRYDPDGLVLRYLDRSFPCLIAKLPPVAEYRSRVNDTGYCNTQ